MHTYLYNFRLSLSHCRSESTRESIRKSTRPKFAHLQQVAGASLPVSPQHMYSTDRLSHHAVATAKQDRLLTFKSKFHLARHVTSRTRHDTFDVSSASRRACRAVLFDKLDTAKMHGHEVSCRVETWRDEPSGIWVLLSATHTAYGCRYVRYTGRQVIQVYTGRPQKSKSQPNYQHYKSLSARCRRSELFGQIKV